MNLKRRLWPWMIGIPLAIGLTIYGIWRWRRGMDRAEYEKQWPIAGLPGDQAVIEKAGARWKASAVIAAVAKPPEVSTLKLGDACDAKLEYVLEFAAGDDAKGQIEWLFESAKRGRYLDENDRERTLRHMASPILVVAVADHAAPEMQGSEYVSGYRVGSAYVYDIDGTLQCAGTFSAENSEVVKYQTWKSNDPRINGNPELDAKRAVAHDLDARMHDMAVAGLKRVTP